MAMTAALSGGEKYIYILIPKTHTSDIVKYSCDNPDRAWQCPLIKMTTITEHASTLEGPDASVLFPKRSMSS